MKYRSQPYLSLDEGVLSLCDETKYWYEGNYSMKWPYRSAIERVLSLCEIAIDKYEIWKMIIENEK